MATALLGGCVSMSDAGDGTARIRFIVEADPITNAQFEAVRSMDRPVIDAWLAQESADRRDLALRLRGHSGRLTFVQGCDVSPPDWQRRQARIATALSARDFTDFLRIASEVERDSIQRPNLRDRRPTTKNELPLRYERDQTARERLGDVGHDSDPALQEALFAQRFSEVCDVDLDNGRWLGSPRVQQFMRGSAPAEALDKLFILAMHADHLPALQLDIADTFASKGMTGDRGLYALRLRDRGLVNMGRVQDTGTLILCEDGQLTLAGGGDIGAIDDSRATIGLPPLDLESPQSARTCS